MVIDARNDSVLILLKKQLRRIVMVRIFVISLVLMATNAVAQNTCSGSSWDAAEEIMQLGSSQEVEFAQRYKDICRSNPECIRFESKESEINELLAIKNDIRNKYDRAMDQFEWFVLNCGFKYKYNAKLVIRTLSGKIKDLEADFADMREDCLWDANVQLKTNRCKKKNGEY